MANTVYLNLGKQSFAIRCLSPSHLPLYEQVNIFASGPSIKQVDFTPACLATPSLFVNGSISLLGNHDFRQVAGYVVSDARFIKHGLAVIKSNYSGQPWFMTLPVLNQLIKDAPKWLQPYHQHINLIQAVNRPIVLSTNLKYAWHKRFSKSHTNARLQKISPNTIAHNSHQHLVWQAEHQPIIGVSLDMQQGFVEAGTVAYVAAQLAYAMQAKQIHLYGVDLINSSTPRFYETQKNQAPCKLDSAITDRIVPSFKLMQQAYGAHGVDVVNHSPVSKDLF